MNKQNEAILLERLADTFENQAPRGRPVYRRRHSRPVPGGRMDAFGWAATYCRLMAERE